jgi:hypothetical protein
MTDSKIDPKELIEFFSGLINKIIKTADLPGKRLELEFNYETSKDPIKISIICEISGFQIFQELFTKIGQQLRLHRDIYHIKISLPEDPKIFNLHIDKDNGVYENYCDDLSFRTNFDFTQLAGGN